MKYRILTNNKVFIIKYKIKWWPFWFTHERSLGPHSRVLTPVVFDTLEEAQKLVDAMKLNDLEKQRTRKWRIVEDL